MTQHVLKHVYRLRPEATVLALYNAPGQSRVGRYPSDGTAMSEAQKYRILCLFGETQYTVIKQFMVLEIAYLDREHRRYYMAGVQASGTLVPCFKFTSPEH